MRHLISPLDFSVEELDDLLLRVDEHIFEFLASVADVIVEKGVADIGLYQNRTR